MAFCFSAVIPCPKVYHKEKDNSINDLNNTDIKPNEEKRYKGSVSRREYLINTPDIYKKGIKLGNESDENDDNNSSNVRKMRNFKGKKLKDGDNLPDADNKDENDNFPKRDNNSIFIVEMMSEIRALATNEHTLEIIKPKIEEVSKYIENVELMKNAISKDDDELYFLPVETYLL